MELTSTLWFFPGTVLAFMYLIANWWINKPRQRNVRTISLTLLYGFVSCCLILSIIFQLLFYAGSDLLSVLSIFVLIIALGIDLTSSIKKDRVLRRPAFWRLGILTIFVVVLYIVPHDTTIQFTYRDYPGFLKYYRTNKDTIDFVDLRNDYFKNDKGKKDYFTIVDNGDTLSHYLYNRGSKFHFYKNYDFYDKADTGQVLLKKHLLRHVPGEFAFGIRSNVKKVNMYLTFKSRIKPMSSLEQQPEVPFLSEEFDLDSQSEVELIENFVDSSEPPPVKYQIHLATDKVSDDTIAFQEMHYWIHKNNLMISILTYNDKTGRDEMVALMNDVIDTMKNSLE